jgi:hypothetical protein
MRPNVPNGSCKTSSTKSSTRITNHSYRKHSKESRGNSKKLNRLAPDEGGVMRLLKVIKMCCETGGLQGLLGSGQGLRNRQ